MQYHSTLGVSGYDTWKLAYPPHWDNEPDEDEEEELDEEEAVDKDDLENAETEGE